MIDKDDCTFSVAYSLLKIKSKAYMFENIFKFLYTYLLGYTSFSPVLIWQFLTIEVAEKTTSAKKCRRDKMILLFTSAITSAFVECRRELERLLYDLLVNTRR